MCQTGRIAGLKMTEVANRQQQGYNKFTAQQQFNKPGDLIWLFIPNAGKLTPQWDEN